MKILSRPKGNAEEYGRWSVNPYLGCPNNCAYCYLKKGPGAKVLGGDKPTLKAGVVSEEHAYHLAMAEILENREQIIRDGGLFVTFTSDPCIPETRELCFHIAADAIDHGVPVMMLTKNAAFYQFDSLEHMIKEGPKMQLSDDERKMMVQEGMLFMTWLGDLRTERVKQNVAFGWTLTGHDELEPNAHSNAYRLQTMRRMSQDGFKTWASIEPVITFNASLRMIEQALEAGCRHFKIGLMTERTRVCRKGFSLGGHDFAPYDRAECCQFVEYVMELTGHYGATVYWKQSFVDYLEGPSKKDPQPVHGMTAREFLSQWPHSVGKDWSMFNNNIKE